VQQIARPFADAERRAANWPSERAQCDLQTLAQRELRRIVDLVAGHRRHARDQFFQRRPDDARQFHRQRGTFEFVFCAAQSREVVGG
jgi:hypothetical protein